MPKDFEDMHLGGGSDPMNAIRSDDRDVEIRISLEKKLETAKKQLDSFIENSPDAIGFYDRSLRLVRVNRAYTALFGWPVEDVIGRHWDEMPHLPGPDELRPLLQIVQSRKKVHGLETYRFTVDGRRLDVSVSVSPFYDENGELDGYAFIVRDITERNRTEAALLETGKLSIVGQLAAGIAHEIRNPLTAVKGFLHLLPGAPMDKQLSYLDIVQAELGRIETIVNELLVLAKPQVHEIKPRDLTAELQDVMTLMEPQALLKGARLVATFDQTPERPLLVNASSQLKQVFLNTIKNALEATTGSDDVTVGLSREDGTVVVRIADKGDGIPNEVLGRIGEPFFTTKEGGTGLGLTICWRILAEHKGTLTFASAQGQGTVVSIRLPVL